MTVLGLGAFPVALVALGALAALFTLNVYRRFRGTRLITCPETHAAAAVALDATHAALAAAAKGRIELRIAGCSRWPEREHCNQACLREIEHAPEDCLLRTIVTRWYAGRRCAFCGRTFAGCETRGHHAALLAADGGMREWSAIAAETLPAVLATDRPVCWNCHVAESFRRAFPALVCDRPAHHPPDAPAHGELP